jgi:hypothetical protein
MHAPTAQLLFDSERCSSGTSRKAFAVNPEIRRSKRTNKTLFSWRCSRKFESSLKQFTNKREAKVSN